MASKETVTVVNMKTRTYNGIIKGQTTEIDAAELPFYEANGFELVKTPAAPKASKEDKKPQE